MPSKKNDEEKFFRIALAITVGALAVTLAVVFGGPGSVQTDGPLLPMIVVLAVSCAVLLSMAGRWKRQRRLRSFDVYPRQYVVHRGTPGKIDGDLQKAAWKRAPWSDAFVEIRGHADAPLGTFPTHLQQTKVKMLWDSQFLYIAAQMEYVEGDEITATFTERNSPIFHVDSDFEVFIDPAGCCHGYKELEMNALNTVWNLMLDRPYLDGGKECSGRVAKEGQANFWDVKAQKTAAKIVRGKLHDSSRPSRWACEIALAHSETLQGAPVMGAQPKVGAFWRANFSRVEDKGETNWTWAPQIAWAAAKQKYQGQVNMHLPDAWGYLVFADERGSLEDGFPASEWRDPAWAVRHVAACVYNAARAFREQGEKRRPASVEELVDANLLDADAVLDFDVSIAGTDDDGYLMTVEGGRWCAEITHQRLLTVKCMAPGR